MGDLLSFFQKLFILYGIAAIGYGTKKYKILPEEIDRGITQIILYISLPALILKSMDFPFSQQLLTDFGHLIFLSIYSLGIAVIIAYIMSNKLLVTEERSGVYQGLIIFGNQGFLGYAVCISLLSQQGVMYAAIFNIVFLFLIWTYGIYLVAKNQDSFSLKVILLNPGILATIIGFLLFILPFQLPSTISNLLQTLGSLTTPLSMLLIGSLMANLSLKQITDMIKKVELWTAALVKLIIIPLLVFPFLLLNIGQLPLMVAILLSAMPSAPTTPIFAAKYDKDAGFGSMGVCITTLLSFISLPMIYGILYYFMN